MIQKLFHRYFRANDRGLTLRSVLAAGRPVPDHRNRDRRVEAATVAAGGQGWMIDPWSASSMMDFGSGHAHDAASAPVDGGCVSCD